MTNLFFSSLGDNLQHASGIILGKLVLRPLGLRFDKSHRGQHTMFSHVSANLSADGIPQQWFPYRMILRRRT